AHQAKRAVSDVLEFPTHWLSYRHRQIGVTALQSLHPRLLIETDDVLVARRVVVDVQHVVALLPELLVVRPEVHLLPVRLKVGIAQDASDGAVADLDALSAYVLAEQRRRPMRHRQSYVFGRSASLAFDAGGVGVRKREIGRPERGASSSLATGSSASAKRA